MQRTKRLYADTRTAQTAASSNLDKLNEDLQDVTRIMTKNMEDLLWRGDSLDREFLRRPRMRGSMWAVAMGLTLFGPPFCTAPPSSARTLLSPPAETHDRDVDDVQLATGRVAQVPESGAEDQLRRHDPQVRTVSVFPRVLHHSPVSWIFGEMSAPGRSHPHRLFPRFECHFLFTTLANAFPRRKRLAAVGVLFLFILFIKFW